METKIDIDSVQASYGRCLLSSGFFDDFYGNFMNKSPLIKARFVNTDMSQQMKLLRHGLNFVILFAKDRGLAVKKMEALHESHSPSHLNIPNWMYSVWHKALIETIREHDKSVTEEVIQNWEVVLDKSIRKISQ